MSCFVSCSWVHTVSALIAGVPPLDASVKCADTREIGCSNLGLWVPFCFINKEFRTKVWRPVTNGRAIPSTWYTINPLRRKDHSVPNYNDCFDQLLMFKRSLHCGSEFTGNGENTEAEWWLRYRLFGEVCTGSPRSWVPVGWGPGCHEAEGTRHELKYFIIVSRGGTREAQGKVESYCTSSSKLVNIYLYIYHELQEHKTAVSISVELIQLHLVCLDENKCPFMILHRPHKG